ncbi:MAG: hypothetical protein EOM19_03720 [Candidatus Moranbacteria bacterium]|nr:hypothetical protein [Candidatus Moranbacteria bacterium]
MNTASKTVLEGVFWLLINIFSLLGVRIASWSWVESLPFPTPSDFFFIIKILGGSLGAMLLVGNLILFWNKTDSFLLCVFIVIIHTVWGASLIQALS